MTKNELIINEPMTGVVHKHTSFTAIPVSRGLSQLMHFLGPYHRIVLIFIILAGSSVRLSFWDQDVGGKHTFRQAHVVNDVISFMRTWDGPELESFERFDKTWAIETKFFDAPIFTIAAATIADFTPLSPVNSARLVSLISFAVATSAVFALGRHVTQSRLTGLISAVIFALSPLSLHFFGAPLPDTMAIALSLSSVVAMINYVDGRQKKWLLLAIVSIIPAVVIKPPSTAVALVGFAGYGFAHWRAHREHAAYFLPIAGYFFAAAAGALSFSVMLSRINWSQWSMPSVYRTWYFGTIDQRLEYATWRQMASVVRHEFSPQEFGIVFSLLGSAIIINKLVRGKAHRGDWLLLGMIGGMLASTLIFFNVTHLHNYYLLPALPPYAIITAIAVHISACLSG